MRSRQAFMIVAFAALFAFSASGCGDESPISKAEDAVSAQTQAGASPAAGESERSDAPAPAGDGSDVAPGQEADPEKNEYVDSRDKNAASPAAIRKRCLKGTKKIKSESIREGLRDQCNNAYKKAMRQTKQSEQRLKAAYEACLEKADRASSDEAREKILIGCASIPH